MAAARWFRDHGHFDPARAMWQWPEGYDPSQLMLGLESRLDEWAAEVRGQFLDLTGGTQLPRYAVGVRAVALVTTGWDAAGRRTTSAVLSPSNESRLAATDAWAGTDEVASRILASLNVEEYIGEFAAVRQGDTGLPQLIDPRDLDDAIEEFLADPQKALGEAAASRADPVLAQSAHQLLDALTAAASAETLSFQTHYETVTALLEGQSPATVASAAEEVGVLAKDAGFFRPSEDWVKFRSSIDFLSASTVGDLPLMTAGDIGAVLRNQRVIREVDRLAKELTFAKYVMAETKKESERGGGDAGDISALRAEVKSHIEKLAKLVNSLGPEA
jgi:hypothetical protein